MVSRQSVAASPGASAVAATGGVSCAGAGSGAGSAGLSSVFFGFAAVGFLVGCDSAPPFAF
jgi:hypothetical protein